LWKLILYKFDLVSIIVIGHSTFIWILRKRQIGFFKRPIQIYGIVMIVGEQIASIHPFLMVF